MTLVNTNGFLLDTNVISEPTKSQPNKAVRAFLKSITATPSFMSMVSVGELGKGIYMAEPERSKKLRLWLDTQLLPAYQGRILPLDAAVIRRWGLFMALPEVRGHNKIAVDALVAATASVHRLTLATRNTADFALFPVQTFDPWTAQP